MSLILTALLFVLYYGYIILIAVDRALLSRRIGDATTLGIPIGTAYLPTARAREGTTFEVDIRGKRAPATVVKTPFHTKGSHL